MTSCPICSSASRRSTGGASGSGPPVYAEYRDEALEVHGYFGSPEEPQVHPTVVDVLGPDYAPHTAEVHIDAEAVSVAEFEDKESLAREAELSKGS